MNEGLNRSATKNGQPGRHQLHMLQEQRVAHVRGKPLQKAHKRKARADGAKASRDMFKAFLEHAETSFYNVDRPPRVQEGMDGWADF